MKELKSGNRPGTDRGRPDNGSLSERFIFYSLAAALIFTPIARGSVRIWAWGPALIVEFALVALWMLRRARSPQSITHSKVNIPIFLFLLLAANSFAFAAYKHDSFFALLRLAGYVGIYYTVLGAFNHAMRRRIVVLAVAIGTALAFYGILQYIGVLPRDWWFPPEFLSATYVNHNHFAGYLELSLPAAVAVAAMRRKPFFAIASVVMLAALLLTQSRGAWLSAGFSLSVMAAAMIRRSAPANRIYGTLIVLLLALSLSALLYFGKDMVSERVSAATDMTAREISSDTRLLIWNGTVRMILAHPFAGNGIGNYVWAFPRYRPPGLNVVANAAHNDYLQMASEMGVLAPLLMAWIFAVLIKSGLVAGRSPYALGCATGVLALALHGMVDFNFHIPANMLLFTVYCSIITGERANA